MKQISGTFQYANGQPVANGRVFFRLSQDAVALSTAQVAPTLISITLNASGQIPANSLIFFNDELSPALTTYTVSVLDASNALQWGAESIYINGASFNLNNATPTSQNVLLANPVIQNPTSQQNINGQVLNMEGTSLSFSAANSTSPDIYLNRLAAGSLGLGTTSANATALLKLNGLGLNGAAAVANGINIGTGGILQISGSTALNLLSAGIQCTIPFLLSDGSGVAPAIAFTNETGTGFSRSSGGQLALSISGARKALWDTTQRMSSSFPLTWSSNVEPFGNAPDTGISRLLPGFIAFGNGTQGDGSGTTVAATVKFARPKASQGNALLVGDVGTLTGFGASATVSSVSGSDAAGTIVIAAAGAGTAANATFTLTFHDGTWSLAPTVVVCRGDGNGPAGAPAFVANVSATAVTIGINGTPSAGTNYIFYFLAVGH